MVTVKGVERPMGSNILAESFSTDCLVAGRDFAYLTNSQRSLEILPFISFHPIPRTFTHVLDDDVFDG